MGPVRISSVSRFIVTAGVFCLLAAGYSGIFNDNQKTLLLHWNGGKWTQVTTPKPVYGELDGVYATAPNNAWAVGFTSTADVSTRPGAMSGQWARPTARPSVVVS